MILRYAGFWPRLGAHFLDFIFLSPFIIFLLWGNSHYRLFPLYNLIPSALFGLFFSVYLVRHFGGTPGKLILGIRIRKLEGEPVGYREAFLRYCPEFLFSLILSIVLVFPLFQMTDAEYSSLTYSQKAKRVYELAPKCYTPINNLYAIWVWGEFVILLTNKRKRALHDFIAGTVVVHEAPLDFQSSGRKDT